MCQARLGTRNTEVNKTRHTKSTSQSSLWNTEADVQMLTEWGVWGCTSCREGHRGGPGLVGEVGRVAFQLNFEGFIGVS